MRTLSTAFGLLSALAFCLPGVARAAAEPKEWTFLVFLNGDNSLDDYSDLNLNQMKKIGSTDKVDIVVIRDRSNQRTTTKILHVEKDKLTTVKDFGSNIDMGDWHAMVDFFNYAKDNYPAKHYAYVMWDHGAGWGKRKSLKPQGLRDISWDDHSGNFITTAQMAQALSEMKSANGGKKIDLFGMDACLMQMGEVVAEIAPSVSVVAASEETEPDEGWDYSVGLDYLVKNPTADTKAIAKTFEQGYVQANGDDVQGSVVDADAVVSAMPALAAFVDELVKFDKLSKRDLIAIMDDTQSFYMSDFKDIIDFTARVQAKSGGNNLKDLAAEAQTAIQSAVHANFTAGASMAQAKGLSVWLPSDYEWSDRKGNYKTLRFGKDSHWTKLLEALYGE